MNSEVLSAPKRDLQGKWAPALGGHICLASQPSHLVDTGLPGDGPASYHCCNKSAQTWWLETAQRVIIPEVRSAAQVSRIPKQSQAPGENSFSKRPPTFLGYDSFPILKTGILTSL